MRGFHGGRSHCGSSSAKVIGQPTLQSLTRIFFRASTSFLPCEPKRSPKPFVICSKTHTVVIDERTRLRIELRLDEAPRVATDGGPAQVAPRILPDQSLDVGASRLTNAGPWSLLPPWPCAALQGPWRSVLRALVEDCGEQPESTCAYDVAAPPAVKHESAASTRSWIVAARAIMYRVSIFPSLPPYLLLLVPCSPVGHRIPCGIVAGAKVRRSSVHRPKKLKTSLFSDLKSNLFLYMAQMSS